jgi:hypothetical protein
VKDGWNILDDNLLACSDEHINRVFDMLSRQSRRPEFTGGLEAARLKKWHAEKLYELKAEQVFFAYDTQSDLEPLIEAGKILKEVGFTAKSKRLRAYVLIGYKNDTFEKAEHRLRQAYNAGFFPMAMLYRDEGGKVNMEWAKFQRAWARPAITYSMLKDRPKDNKTVYDLI